MLYKRRLRSRIIFSFLLFGTLLSGLFAVSTLFLQSSLENNLIGETLKQECSVDCRGTPFDRRGSPTA